MALYRLRLRTVSRGRGELVLALAAYVAGERLYLEREHQTFNFSWKSSEVVHRELIGAYGRSREALWNEAEWAEGRWDGVTGREILVTLPAELSRKEQVALARALARHIRRRYRVAVDLAIHLPATHRGGDPRNVHAHLVITARVMTPAGLGERTRVWDRAYAGGPELRHLRKYWARLQNLALERAGLDARVDHRSYRDQGLERLPGRHLGPVLTTLERQGTPTRLGDYNRAVEVINRVRAALGRDLSWDWEAMPTRFSDRDGLVAYKACRRRMLEINQSIAALEGDAGALTRSVRREIEAERAELLALRLLLRPCMHAEMEARIRLRREERVRRRERERGRGRAA